MVIICRTWFLDTRISGCFILVSDRYQINQWVSVKAGLWTVDWTMDWTVDCTMD